MCAMSSLRHMPQHVSMGTASFNALWTCIDGHACHPQPLPRATTHTSAHHSNQCTLAVYIGACTSCPSTTTCQHTCQRAPRDARHPYTWKHVDLCTGQTPGTMHVVEGACMSCTATLTCNHNHIRRGALVVDEGHVCHGPPSPHATTLPQWLPRHAWYPGCGRRGRACHSHPTPRATTHAK